MPGTTRLVDPSGQIHDVPNEIAAGALDRGWRPPTTDQELAAAQAQATEADYGGVGGAVKAGLAGVARGATLGASDLAARLLGGEDAAFDLESLREVNPGVSLAGELAGSFSPVGPAALAGRVGSGVTRALSEGAGLAGRVGAGAAGEAVTGALYGAGAGLSEVSLADRPLDIEHVAAAIGSNALYGAGLGGAIGGAGKLAEAGLARAKGAIDSALERRAAKARTPAEAIETGDLELLDNGKLKEARKAEIEAINAARAPARESLVHDIQEYRREMYAADVFTVHHGIAPGEISEMGGALKKADKVFRHALDVKVELAEKPEKLLTALRKQEQAMQGLHDWAVPQLEAHAARDLRAEALADLQADAEAARAASAADTATAPGRTEVAPVGRPSERRFEIRAADGTATPIARADVNEWLEKQMPAGFKPGPALETHRGFSIEHGVPATAADIVDNAVYITKPSELARRGIHGNELLEANRDSITKAWGEGKRLAPIDIDVTPDGRLFVEDGNHRLQAAARDDRPIAARFRRTKPGWEPQANARDITERIKGELPKTTKRAESFTRKVPDEIGPFTPSGMEHAADREAARRHAALETQLERLQRIDHAFPVAMARNREIQQKIAALTAPPTSARLAKIDEALEHLASPRAPSLGAAVVGLAAPFAGPLGAAAAAGARTIGGLRKLAEAAGERAAKTVSTFLSGAAKVAPVAPPLATKVLTSLRYGDERPGRQTLEATLPAAYKARTDEIKEQVHVAADGSYQMRPAARAKMAAKLDGIRAHDPIAADRIETAGARRIEYLASIMPRLPDFGTIPVGPERRRVPELAMRSWARSAYAAEHPLDALAAMAGGSFVPEYAKTLHAVHPEIVADYIRQVSEQLPTLRAKLPYKRRLALSILTGVPVDPAMTPGVLRVIQSMYAAEPGTQGGTQAPRAEPQFGSVRAAPATPAEQRQAGGPA